MYTCHVDRLDLLTPAKVRGCPLTPRSSNYNVKLICGTQLSKVSLNKSSLESFKSTLNYQGRRKSLCDGVG